MLRLDATLFAFGTAGLTAVEPDPSLLGFIKNASVVGSVVGAGWLLEARVGKKIAGAIENHTAVEDQRLAVVKAEFNGAMDTLAAKLDGIDEKLDRRPCAMSCNCQSHTPVPR